MGPARNLYLLASSPLAELKKLIPQAEIDFDPGQSLAEAVLWRSARTSWMKPSVRLQSTSKATRIAHWGGGVDINAACCCFAISRCSMTVGSVSAAYFVRSAL